MGKELISRSIDSILQHFDADISVKDTDTAHPITAPRAKSIMTFPRRNSVNPPTQRGCDDPAITSLNCGIGDLCMTVDQSCTQD